MTSTADRPTLADRLRAAANFTPSELQETLAVGDGQNNPASDHEYVDDNGDGECDICGQPEDAHSKAQTTAAEEVETLASPSGAKHDFVDNGHGKCKNCGMPEEMHKGYATETGTAAETVQFKPYPWDQCIQDQLDKGYDEARAKAICGSIRAQAAQAMETFDVDCHECNDNARDTLIASLREQYALTAEFEQALQELTAAAPVEIDPDNPGRFKAVLAVEGERTADNRIITEGATTWRPPPLPLMLMTKTADGHDGAEVAGVIENIFRDGHDIVGEGRFDTGERGLEAARLVANKVLTGISIDAGDVNGEIEVESIDQTSGEPTAVLAKMTALCVLGATICPMQAIGSASIEYVVGDDPAGTFNFEQLAADAVTYAVTASKSLPMSGQDSGWDQSAADKRVRAWAGADDAPNAKYASAFFWKEGDGTNFGDYHLQFADVVNGKLTAIWHGVTAAAAAVQGSRGASLPYADQVKGAIATYYKKAEKQYNIDATPPWEAAAETITAAGPMAYPKAAFTDPVLSRPTYLHVEQIGEDLWHVFGHIALWGTCHIGFPGTCVTPPRSMSRYSHFLTGSLPLIEGGNQPVGTITMDTNHPTDRPRTAREAAAHYDHTGTAAAFVNVGEDDHGIWCSGIVKPGLDEADATVLCASKMSGDWRRIAGKLELVAVLSVNTPGFPIAYTHDDEQVALVAAGYGPTQPSHHDQQTMRELGDLRAEFAAFKRLMMPVLRDHLASRLTVTSTAFGATEQTFDYDEDKHPRDSHGRWDSTGGGGVDKYDEKARAASARLNPLEAKLYEGIPGAPKSVENATKQAASHVYEASVEVNPPHTDANAAVDHLVKARDILTKAADDAKDTSHASRLEKLAGDVGKQAQSIDDHLTGNPSRGVSGERKVRREV